jgi:transcriptional regulator with XRE-family HTH domain
MDAPSFTPEQCRAARALLNWSQSLLASKAGVAKKTLQLFELGRRGPYARTLEALQGALSKGGVEFIPENGGGPGVRLAKRKGKWSGSR